MILTPYLRREIRLRGVRLQHTATHCNTLHYSATLCKTCLCPPPAPQNPLVYDGSATHCNTLQHTATHCNTLEHTTIHCDTLQHTATHCNIHFSRPPAPRDPQAYRASTTHCSTLQHTATHCNTLQHTATHCNTLQHPATHCNIHPPPPPAPRDLLVYRASRIPGATAPT